MPYIYSRSYFTENDIKVSEDNRKLLSYEIDKELKFLDEQQAQIESNQKTQDERQRDIDEEVNFNSENDGFF